MNDNYSIQKRRNEKLSELRGNREKSSKSKFVCNSIIRIGISAILLGAVYFSFCYNHPVTNKVRVIIEENFTKEIDFSNIYDTYIDNFAGNPAIIPSFINKENEGELSQFAFTSPISELPKQIRQTDKGLYLDTVINEDVLAIGKGLVVNVGVHAEYGNTIVVRYENGIESVYAMMDEVYVEQNDWIEPGELLGSVENCLFFAMYEEEEYLSPLDVITFD